MGRKKKEEETAFETPEGDEEERQSEEPAVVKRSFIGNHELVEYADGTVSLDGAPRVSKEIMKTTIEAVQIIKGEKAQKQLDLEGRPLPDPEVLEDESTETKTFALYFSNGLRFRMGEEALDKALDKKSTESVSDRNDRVKLMVQNRVKVLAPSKPLDPNKWDAGTKAIYERIMIGHGKDP